MKLFGRLQPTLWAALFFTYVTTVGSSGIMCYYCTVAPKPGSNLTGGQICRHFEETPHFQVWCPNSTLCMKRSIHHRLGNGTLVLTSIERGCTPQLLTSQVYDFQKKTWGTKQEIRSEEYDERCFVGEDRGSPGGPPEYCFCSYHLCNGSLTPKNWCLLTVLSAGLVLWIQRCFH